MGQTTREELYAIAEEAGGGEIVLDDQQARDAARELKRALACDDFGDSSEGRACHMRVAALYRILLETVCRRMGAYADIRQALGCDGAWQSLAGPLGESLPLREILAMGAEGFRWSREPWERQLACLGAVAESGFSALPCVVWGLPAFDSPVAWMPVSRMSVLVRRCDCGSDEELALFDELIGRHALHAGHAVRALYLRETREESLRHADEQGRIDRLTGQIARRVREGWPDDEQMLPVDRI